MAIDADIVMIESLLLQTSRAHQLRSRIHCISSVLGAGGGVLVKKALALDNKSLENATDEDVKRSLNLLTANYFKLINYALASIVLVTYLEPVEGIWSRRLWLWSIRAWPTCLTEISM
jgi:hypothetical protein